MKMKTHTLTIMAMVAALYAAITVSQAAIGFGPIQFRIAESLNLLAFFNPIFAPAVLLGVFVANLFSPYGLVDIIFGTLASLVALLLILATKKLTNNLFIASLWPTIVNALVIPLVFLIYGGDGVTLAAFIPFAQSVAIGQFVVVTLFGYTICRVLMARYPNFITIIKNVDKMPSAEKPAAQIKLEPLSLENARDVYEFEIKNRAYFEKHLASRGDDYYEPEKYNGIIAAIIDEQNSGECFMYVIRDEAGGVAGRVNFTSVQSGDVKTAELGYRIGQESAGKGIATKAVAMAIKLGTEKHKLEGITAGTSTENIASQRVLEKNGFVFVEKANHHMQINGEWVDSLKYARKTEHTK